jgi:integral membrane protein
MKATPLLGWYRALAIATGVALLVFCGFIVAKYAFDTGAEITTYVAMLHGYLYLGYFVVTFLLGQKLKWPLGRMIFTLAAGCIPFASFVAERAVVRDAAALAPAEQAPEAAGV